MLCQRVHNSYGPITLAPARLFRVNHVSVGGFAASEKTSADMQVFPSPCLVAELPFSLPSQLTYACPSVSCALFVRADRLLHLVAEVTNTGEDESQAEMVRGLNDEVVAD